MTKDAQKVLKDFPLEWADTKELLKRFPAVENAPLTTILAELERSGRIEADMRGNPPRYHARKRTT